MTIKDYAQARKWYEAALAVNPRIVMLAARALFLRRGERNHGRDAQRKP